MGVDSDQVKMVSYYGRELRQVAVDHCFHDAVHETFCLRATTRLLLEVYQWLVCAKVC